MAASLCLRVTGSSVSGRTDKHRQGVIDHAVDLGEKRPLLLVSSFELRLYLTNYVIVAQPVYDPVVRREQ